MDRPHNLLVIEAPKILHAASATCDHDDIRAWRQMISLLNCFRNFDGRAGPLHATRDDSQLTAAPTTSGDFQKIPYRGARGTRDDSNMTGKSRERFLGNVKEAFCR